MMSMCWVKSKKKTLCLDLLFFYFSNFWRENTWCVLTTFFGGFFSGAVLKLEILFKCLVFCPHVWLTQGLCLLSLSWLRLRPKHWDVKISKNSLSDRHFVHTHKHWLCVGQRLTVLCRNSLIPKLVTFFSFSSYVKLTVPKIGRVGDGVFWDKCSLTS